MDKQVIEAIVKNEFKKLNRIQQSLLLKLEEKKYLSDRELQNCVKEGKLHRDVTSEAFLPLILLLVLNRSTFKQSRKL